MPLFLRAYAWISAVAGGLALSVAVTWYAMSWDGGLQIPPPIVDDLTDIESLFSMNLWAALFDLGVPVCCLAAAAFGIPARKHLAAKAGLIAAATAMALYAVYLRACHHAVWS